MGHTSLVMPALTYFETSKRACGRSRSTWANRSVARVNPLNRSVGVEPAATTMRFLSDWLIRAETTTRSYCSLSRRVSASGNVADCASYPETLRTAHRVRRRSGSLPTHSNRAGRGCIRVHPTGLGWLPTRPQWNGRKWRIDDATVLVT
jgi:hypothetical protein